MAPPEEPALLGSSLRLALVICVEVATILGLACYGRSDIFVSSLGRGPTGEARGQQQDQQSPDDGQHVLEQGFNRGHELEQPTPNGQSNQTPPTPKLTVDSTPPKAKIVKLPAKANHVFYSDSHCKSKTGRRDDWRAAKNCIDVVERGSPPYSMKVSCVGPYVNLRRYRAKACSGKGEKQLPLIADVWHRIRRGECVYLGATERGVPVYAKLSISLEATYGEGCEMGNARMADYLVKRGAKCPLYASDPDHGRRLPPTVDLPIRWAAFEEEAARRKYDNFTGFVSYVFKGEETSVAKYTRGSNTVRDSNFTLNYFAGVKFVLGIMTATSYCNARNAHRVTWMRYENVCPLSRHQDPKCNVFPVFVFADVNPEMVEKSDDILVLKDAPSATEVNSGFNQWWEIGKTREMWREGQFKTPAFFKYALREFGWATHVGKMDLDTYPFINIIYDDFIRLPQQGIFYGRKFNIYPNGMLGEFYAITSDLLSCWVEQDRRTIENDVAKSSWWFTTAEDQVFSKILRKGCPALYVAVPCQLGMDCDKYRWRHVR